jgi:Chitobiase/beta-hexosaminidase C-terminal domain/RHS Repeat
MPSRMRYGLLVSLAVISLIVVWLNTSYGEAVNYIYDELNRLKRIEYQDGTFIEYIYDQAGNRLQTITPSSDITPPTTTPSPSGGAYNTAQSVTLACNDGSGSGCDKTYYSTNGTDPSTPYTSPISISATTTLKFFSKDLASNNESVKTQVYTIETTPPTGTISINSGAANTNSINVTLTLTCSDANGCSQMRFSNNNTTYSEPETYTPSKAWVLTTGDGTKTVYVKFRDTAGNWSAAYNDTIVLHTSLPTGSININSWAASTISTNVTLTLSCYDANGCSQMQFSNDNVTYSTPETYATPKTWALSTGDGTKTVYVKFKDNADNWSTPYNDTILLDTTPPTGTNTINSGAAFTNNTNVTLTLTCSDANSCSQVQFSNDNGTYSGAQAYGTPKSWTLTSGNGPKTVWAKFKDTPGNWSTPSSDSIVLDATAPTTTAAPPGGAYNSAQSVTLSCTDTGDSGCDKIYYTTDGTFPNTSSPQYSSPINISATTTLRFFAKDFATNSEAVKTQTYTMDTTPPTGSISINSGAASTISTNVTLTLSCSDTNGCSQMRFSNDNVDYSTPETYATTKAWTLTTGDGTKTAYVKFKDSAQNWSIPYSDTILLDTTPPTGTVTINGGAAFTKNTFVTLTLTCSDTNSCSQVRFSNDNVTYSGAQAYGTPKSWTLASGDGTKTVYAIFKDTPGNWSTPSSDSILLDTTAPTTTASPPGGTYAGSVDVTLSCADGAGSGCDKIYYTTNGSYPTTSSPQYSSPIHISGTTTLRFFATDFAGNSEAVKTQNYTITP